MAHGDVFSAGIMQQAISLFKCDLKSMSQFTSEIIQGWLINHDVLCYRVAINRGRHNFYEQSWY